MKIINWPTYVNQNVLEETSITIGEGGVIEDSSATGYKERRLSAIAIPDKFNVVMDFDWNTLDSNGYSEYDRFVRWYKFVHKRGMNPFWFPSITKHPVTDLTGSDNNKLCLYKITSSLTPSPSGLSMRVTMTWEEIYSGIIDVPNETPVLDKIIPHSEFIEVFYTPSLPTEVPSVENYNIYSRPVGDSNYTVQNPSNIVMVNNAFRLYLENAFKKGVYDIYVNVRENEQILNVF